MLNSVESVLHNHSSILIAQALLTVILMPCPGDGECIKVVLMQKRGERCEGLFLRTCFVLV